MSQVRVYPDPMNRADQVIKVPRDHPKRVEIFQEVSNVLNVPGHESESDEVRAAINWTGEEMAPHRGESDQQNEE